MKMEKDNKEPYIIQKEENEYLYTRLQKKTLEEVQRLSGKVWSDFNVHDPGVTLADIANYALTELDYKFRFALEDYLTEKGGTFEPERFGLFPPEKVYTTQPVTTEDYRRLFFSYIPELENVWVMCNPDTGGYTVSVVLPPFEEVDEKKVIKRIRETYNSHRNLCEYLDKVIIMQPEELEFHAELEIELGNDASIVLASLYAVILRYLSGSVSISVPEEWVTSGLSPEEWLEGSESSMRVDIPRQQSTEYELYGKLWQVEGIRSFSICYLMKDGKPLTDFSGGFSLKIPKDKKELKVRIHCGRSVAEIDMEKFTKNLQNLYHIRERRRTGGTGIEETDWGSVKGTYRDIFTHPPIAGEFPLCYGLSPDQEPSTSFEAYLKLYDLTIQQGLQEVKELPRLLSIGEEYTDYSSARNLYALKSRYLDFLDRLYGVESQPVWLLEQDNYGETELEILLRRMTFLRNIPRMLKNRARARDITDMESETNLSGVKEWFCRLLGINTDEGHTVSNVLPGHSLWLIEKKADRPLFDRRDAMLIDERLLDLEKMWPVTYEKLATDDKGKHEEYSQMRVELPIFNENRISGDLFRHGTCLDNYRIVDARKDGYMLVFHNRERGGWTNLGRTDDRQRLNTLANILRRYLRELNRECETIYIIEPVLSKPGLPFQLLVVLPMWTLRFHTPRFRDMCRELLRSIIPAHLTSRIYWLDEKSMQDFEHCYKQWIRTLSNTDLAEYGGRLLEAMSKLLEANEKKHKKTDT